MSASAPEASAAEGSQSGLRDLCESAARHLEEQARALVPGYFQELAGYGRPLLLEVACSPTSVWTRVAREHGYESSRCADWNGCDLSTEAGVRLILEQVELEKPQHIWIAPPCGAFSPLQHINQRTPEQRADLQAKRQHAIKMYRGASVVARFCVQRGIHVTWEWSERCQAWRLPLMQKLREKVLPFTAVVSGCSVNLREAGGDKLLRKSWRVVTTHARLAESLHLPCRCPSQYQHGKCEGGNAERSAFYTPEMAKRVVRCLSQELSYHSALQECEGVSQLPEGFGLGEFCVCGDQLDPQQALTCGSCLIGRSVLRLPPPEDAMFSEQEKQQARTIAQELQKKPKLDYPDLLKLLQSSVYPTRSHTRQVVQDNNPKPHYSTFGTYAHGNHYGLTKQTGCLKEFVACVNRFLKQELPKGSKWSSFAVSRNNALPLHRDLHNDPGYPNHLIAVGNFKRGELWIEEKSPDPQDPNYRTLADGSRVAGRVQPVRHKVTTFLPRLWHETQPWEGERVVVTAYVSRGFWHLGREDRAELRALGFEVPVEGGSGVEDSSQAVLSRGSEETQCCHMACSGAERQEGREKQSCHVGAEVSHYCQVACLGEERQENREKQSCHVNQRTGGGGSFQPRQQRQERLKKQLYLLHAATGHGSTRHLVEALKRRNASQEVLNLARSFRCSICAEKARTAPRPLATLNPLPPKWSTVSGDVGNWKHPRTQETVQFVLLIDECSRFRTARILTRGAHQTPTSAACIHYLQEGWIQYFGTPHTLRLDPAGAFRSQTLEGFCERQGIYLDVIPGEAHWQIGVCEQAIHAAKTIMTKVCEDHPEIDPEEALALAIRTCNHKDDIRGYSPAQHVLGKCPDDTSRILPATGEAIGPCLVENGTGEFERTQNRRVAAEKAHLDWVAQQRIVRAQNSRHRPLLQYEPGELVYFWRSQVSGQGRREPGDKHGRFLGPCLLYTSDAADEHRDV